MYQHCERYEFSLQEKPCKTQCDGCEWFEGEHPDMFKAPTIEVTEGGIVFDGKEISMATLIAIFGDEQNQD